MIYDYLKSHYKLGEPIFLSEINIPNMTNENLRYHLKKMTDDGIIDRFEPGIYYFPKTDILGNKIALSPETVALHKYIMHKGKYIGYYSGHTLANHLGLTTQVPLIQEITSNNAPAKVRKIKIGNINYIIRKPYIEITNENVIILQFLDCLKDINKYSEENLEACGKILTNFASRHNITKSMIDSEISNYPIRIYKAIYETGVNYVSS